jgi:hypothetical protein
VKCKEEEGRREAWRFSLTVRSAAESASFQDTQSEQAKSNSPEDRVRYESRFHTTEVKVHFEPEVVRNLRKFLLPDQADELRAQALDKLARLSEESQLNLLEMIQQRKVSKVDFSVDRIVVEVPFKAHNSKFVNEPEHLRDRKWRVTVRGFSLAS